jgi:cytochrome b561
MSSEQTRSALVQTYDTATRHLHWLSAALIAGLWLLGQTIDDFAKGTPRMNARSVHIAIGLALLLVFAVRVWRRSQGKVQTFEPREPLVEWSHLGIYLLLGAVLLLGALNASLRTDWFFGWFRFPRIVDAGGDDLKELIENLHALAANALAFVAVGHAAMALFHHYVRKDQVLRRMLPGNKN